MSVFTLLADAAQQAATYPAPHDPDWSNTITLGNLIVLLGVVGGCVTLFMNQRKVRRENEADIESKITKATGGLRTDVDRLQQKTADHLTATVIEDKIEHLKVNRQQIEAGHDTRIDRNARDIIELRIALGKVEQKHEGLEEDVSEIKSLLKEQRSETKAGFDKLQDCLNDIAKKV